ncbi:MAG TPA: sulfatase-like hydrolase/transferase [Actinomycetota bacterium]|nr:sulfatase-like hydrolase/transferase [Actinomycetota bacterium]
MRPGSPGVRRLLVVGALVVAVVGGVTIGTRLLGADDGGTVDRPSSAVVAKPDIYYIVLEEYAGSQVLRNQFGFDNEPFLRALEARGFFVARRSTTNYPRTYPSVASSLNMDYVDALTPSVPRDATDVGPLDRLIDDNAVGRTLKAHGYSWIQLASWWQPTIKNPNADEVIRYTKDSVLPPAVLGVSTAVPADIRPFRYGSFRRVLFEFDQLSRMPLRPGPKFVFAHIVSPHAPYVFDRQGRYVPIERTRTRDEADNYVDQLAFVNRMVLRLVDRLLTGSGRRPVVVIQSDEGPYDGEPFSWQPIDPVQLSRKFPILNAYYLPGGRGLHALSPTITPVNSFRVVLNAYLGTGLAVLPDRNLVFRNANHLYAFTDVTARVQALP